MVAAYSTKVTLLPTTTITTAVTGTTTTPIQLPADTCIVTLQSAFVYGSSGTSAKIWVQTSIDGTNWHDICNFAYATTSLVKVASSNGMLAATHATATDGTLADNTIVNGYIGGQLRLKYTTTGTYAGSTTVNVTAVIKSLTNK